MQIGLVGRRSGSGVAGFRSVPGVSVVGVCDLNPIAAEDVRAEHGLDFAVSSYPELLDQVDAVAIGSPMQCHAEQAILALEMGKHVLSEVTAAVTLQECDAIYAAYLRSGKRYMMAENYCYFEENMVVRELARRGDFGDLYYAEGKYLHEVRDYHHTKDGDLTWRAKWQVGAPGNTYITHELGPAMQWFRAVDPAERIAAVVCLGSGVHTDPEHPHDDTSVTLVKLASGKLINLRLDMMSNRPHETHYHLQGTRGVYDSDGQRIWLGEGVAGESREWAKLPAAQDVLSATVWDSSDPAGRYAGHGGGDFRTAREFAAAIMEDREPDISPEEGLEWTAAGLCSQLSIAQGGVPIQVPRFGS